MAQQKAAYQTFETKWTRATNWARGQGVPMSSILPVYQMDSKRLMEGGYLMSTAEVTRAILASYNPNNVTPLPTDKPQGGIGGFFGNVLHDASNIFTGLEPTHLVDSIYQSVKNTVEHPGWLLDPEKNTLAQLIPGVSLIGEFEQGGIDAVLAHPLITALNVLSVASAGTNLIGHTALADTLAAKLGVPGGRAAIGGREGLGPIGIARKAVGNIGTGKQGFSRTPDGELVYGPLTVSARAKNYFNVKGMGSDTADINALVHSADQQASSRFFQLTKDFAVANAKLGNLKVDITDDHLAKLFSADVGTTMSASKAAYNLVTMSGKSYRDLAMNDAIPTAIKELLPHYQKAEEWLEENALASEELVKIRLPDGTVGAFTQSESRPIVKARDAFLAQAGKVKKISRNADRLADEIQHNDTVAQPALDALAQIGGLAKSTLSEQIHGTLGVSDKVAQRHPGFSQASVARLLQTTPTRVSTVQARMIADIFKPGGLVDAIAEAYQREDFTAFRDLSLSLVKQMRSKQLAGESVGSTGTRLVHSQFLLQMRTVAENLYSYGKARQAAEVKLSKALGGKYASAKQKASLAREFKKSEQLKTDFERTVWRHPAAAWQPLFVRLTNEKLAESEQGAIAVERALTKIKDSAGLKKLDQKTLEDIRSDPTRVIELLRTYITASHKSPFGADLPDDLVRTMEDKARDDIEWLRATGFVPHYVPNFSSRDKMGAYDAAEGTFNVKIQPTHYSTPDAAHARLMDQSNTIYDVFAGMSRAMKQRIQADATETVIDDHLIPTYGYKQSEMLPLILAEHPLLGLTSDEATTQAYVADYLENTLGLTRFDPKTFGLSSSRHIAGEDTIWMPKAIVDGLKNTVDYAQLGKVSSLPGVAAATGVFRESVLGYSPRFIAHILFGGSFLMALREPASFLQLPHAFKMLKDPEFRAAIHTRSTQVGADNPVAYGVMSFHEETGKTMGRLWAHEMMDKLGLDPSKMTSWLKVVPQMTFKLTNTITDMQRAAIVLQGIGRAERHGRFTDPATGEVMDMTDERALYEGIKAANKVMGDLSHMTPLERNVMTTVMPFYGWTRHILEYVATYPVDHPYRAVFLAYLANMNSDQVSKGLYTRIQNLFFLGSPDQQGNVSALDVRFLNPLRDVANYATLGGLISTLNPVISAPFTMVDPEVVFGNNVLYPNLTYNALYGVKSAAAAGNLYTAVEQFVPEVTALQAALQQGSQYRNLAKTNPNSFAKVIFGALNIPFAQVQHLNLKQIAATQEIDRYQQASQAAQQAFQTGDFAALSGYGDVPNPLQSDYNISPAQLEAIYQAELRSAPGLPPSETLPALPAPPGL